MPTPHSLARHAATRYVQPLRKGGSLPAVVDTADGGLFVVKFRAFVPVGVVVHARTAGYLGMRTLAGLDELFAAYVLGAPPGGPREGRG